MYGYRLGVDKRVLFAGAATPINKKKRKIRKERVITEHENCVSAKLILRTSKR